MPNATLPTSWKWTRRLEPGTARTVFLRLDRTDVPPPGDSTVLHVRADWFAWLDRTTEGQAVSRLIEAAPEAAGILRRLLEWEARMGGFESALWSEARAVLAAIDGAAPPDQGPPPDA
jgi:hypothetical protein